MKSTFAILALSLASTLACSQQPAAGSDEDEKPTKTLRELKKDAAAAGILSRVSEEQLKSAEDTAQSAAKSILDAYERNMPTLTQEYKATQRKSDQIADEAMQAEREKALEFLGLDPQADSAVSIFLSWSMPLEMMRSYVLDAMWSGASVYFRGLPPNKELMEFITKDLRSLVYGKRAANISIDPRMFDVFKVTTVPAVVFATTRDQFNCKDVAPVQFTSNEKVMTYDTCAPLPDDAYWKVSGAVSTSYALNTFLEDGAPGVKPYVAAISKGYALGVPPGKDQTAFTGEWEDVLSPEEWEINRKYDERLKQEAAKAAATKAAPPKESIGAQTKKR